MFESLLMAVERLVTEGVAEFIVGQHGGFDRMVVRAVFCVKQYREVKLTLLTPYHPVQRFCEVPPGVDQVWYPFETAVLPRVAIVRANRIAVERCDRVLTYAKQRRSSRTRLKRRAFGAFRLRLFERRQPFGIVCTENPSKFQPF